MDRKLYSILKIIYDRIPILRPLMRIGRQILFGAELSKKMTFSGWGMTTKHELPWVDKYNWSIFRRTTEDIKENFERRQGEVGVNLDELLWRHWIVVWAVNYAIKFSKNNNFVELGTGDGKTAFFALREIEAKLGEKYNIFLYDAWQVTKEECRLGKFADLSIERTKKNLSEFTGNLIYHEGYVPESLSFVPCPSEISYIHFDLNSATATLEGLKFFYPKMVNGGVILFDDYGRPKYKEKEVVDAFFADKLGILLKFPTGQAIYFIA